MITKRKKIITEELVSYGGEPIWSREHDKLKFSIHKFLNWYSCTKDSKHAKKYLMDYIKLRKIGDKIFLDFIESFSEKNFKNTYGWLARIITKSHPDSNLNEYEKKLNEFISELLVQSQNKEVKKPNKKNTENPEPKIVEKHLNNTLYLIDTRLDNFFENGQYVPLNLFNYLQEFPHTKDEVDYLINYFTKIKKEWENCFIDEDIRESYDFISDSDLKIIIEIYEKHISDVNQYTQQISAPVQRKPRKKKIITPEKQVRGLKYLSNCSELEVKSIEPKNIINKNSLITFNIKSRQLAIYYSKAGFKVKGTTLLNFDSGKSFSKIIRNPQKDLRNYISTSLKVLENRLESIKAAKKPLTGRINSDTLLLSVY
jgi:hypothetical protein